MRNGDGHVGGVVTPDSAETRSDHAPPTQIGLATCFVAMWNREELK